VCPNLREIALRAGVSHTTVSLALRNHPRVSIATRERILKLADGLGYRPNALVSALMGQVRTNRRVTAHEVLGFLSSGRTPDHWRQHRSFVQNFEGAQARADSLGFRLEPFWLGPLGRDATAIAKVLQARGIRGGILGPFLVPHGPVNFDWDHLATVAIGYSFTQIALSRAASHHVNGMLTLFRELSALGYRRIGLALTRQDMIRVQHYWLAGLLTGQSLYGGQAVPAFLFEGEAEKSRLFAWWEENRPDVVVSVGWEVYRWLLGRGLRIPHDLAFAQLSLDGAYPNIAGIEQKSALIGAAAIDLIVGQLYRNEYGPPEVPKILLIDAVWVPGASAPGRSSR
jgi:LacI family transcriptional regulator